MTVTRRRAAFTLVELLVVIGIIALLISILLPSLSAARESASRARCLSNNRQLVVASVMYVDDNDLRTPDAAWDNGNVFGNPYSPRGSKERGWGGPYEPGTPITDPQWGQGAVVLPSIGGVLLPYVGDQHEGVWTCNSAPAQEAGRAGAIYHGDDPYLGAEGDPARGATDGDRWLPNYHYMSMKGQFWNVGPDGGSVASFVPFFRLDDWLVRNVAGLRVTRLETVSGQGSSEVVMFRPFASTYHTAPGLDIYDLEDGQTAEFGGVYAYADGHASFERYGDVDGYVAAHHDPIEQTCYTGGTAWTSAYADQYARRYRD